MVWAENDSTVGGVDVSDRYIDLYQKQLARDAKGIQVNIRMYKSEQCVLDSDGRILGKVTIRNSKGELVATGETAGPTDDMNRYLTFLIPLGKDYTIEYMTSKGFRKDKLTIDAPKDIQLYFNVE
jgi:hypothetical protein